MRDAAFCSVGASISGSGPLDGPMVPLNSRRDMTRTLQIAVIPGDGIGQEVVPVAVDLLKAVTSAEDHVRIKFEEFPWGCEYYKREGQMMPDNGISTLRRFDAILLGAVGD